MLRLDHLPSIVRRDGQAVAEFALVLPVLLILLLGVADLGRVFTAGIVIQAASRDAAEAAAQQYVQLSRGSTMDSPALYQALHATAERVACAEAERLSGVATFPSTYPAGTSWVNCSPPAIAVCVHDTGVTFNGSTEPGDTDCDGHTFSFESTGSVPAGCTLFGGSVPPSPPPDPSGLPYVEVRMCYPFSMLLQTQILPIGPIYLQQSSSFVAATY